MTRPAGVLSIFFSFFRNQDKELFVPELFFFFFGAVRSWKRGFHIGTICAATPDPPTLRLHTPTHRCRRFAVQSHKSIPGSRTSSNRGRGSGTRWHKSAAHTCTPTVTVGSSEPPGAGGIAHACVRVAFFFFSPNGDRADSAQGKEGGGRCWECFFRHTHCTD